MHKLIITISVKPKIMINSPEVCFDITRQHAQVGDKNINIFIYKNSLGSFCRKGKQFIQNDLLHKVVQFLARELVMTRHTTYPKFRYIGVVVFELW
jgi:hypothetical protein